MDATRGRGREGMRENAARAAEARRGAPPAPTPRPSRVDAARALLPAAVLEAAAARRRADDMAADEPADLASAVADALEMAGDDPRAGALALIDAACILWGRTEPEPSTACLEALARVLNG